MSTRSKLRSNLWLAFCAGALGVALIITRTRPAREIGADIIFSVVLSVNLALSSAFCLIRQRRDARPAQRRLQVIVIVAAILGAVTGVTGDRTRLPWVTAGAFATVDAFMTDLKTADYTSAVAKLTARLQECVTPDDLNVPNSRPASWRLDDWKLNEMGDSNTIFGSAVFPDGKELRLVVNLAWLKGRWQVDGFLFGTGREERLDFWVKRCHE